MPTFSDVLVARKSLTGYVYETPIIFSNTLSIRTGHEAVLLKCENLQRTGSYHLRGHTYKVIRTKEEDLGVDNFITFSTANGGTALSCAAANFQSSARVVVPEGTSDLVTGSIAHYRGTYHFCKPNQASRSELVNGLLEQYNRTDGKTSHQAVFVHPYDDETIITGHGTIGVELMLQTDCDVDCVVATVGGGALIAGLAIAVKGMKPHVAVFAAEPMDVDESYESFKRGELVVDRREGDSGASHSLDSNTVAKSLRCPLFKRTREYIRRNVDGVIRVSEAEIKYAMRYVFERCKLVIDTNAATAVAAVLACPPEIKRYRRVAIILSGGNIDLHRLPEFMSAKL